MKGLIVILGLISAVSSSYLAKFNSQKESVSSLRFKDKACYGFDFPPQMRKDFITYANDAYRKSKNLSQNIIYIKQQLDDHYSDEQDQNFVVFVQNNLGSTSFGHCYITLLPVCAGLRGVIKQASYISYYFIKIYAPSYQSGEYRILKYGMLPGPAVTPGQLRLINMTINQFEGSGLCSCNVETTLLISDNINEKLKLAMSIWCDVAGSFVGYIWPKEEVYAVVRPKSCYYFMYSSIDRRIKQI